MSLVLFENVKEVPEYLRVISHNDSYFNANVKLENTDKVRELLYKIDDARYLSPETFISNLHPNRGGLFINYLSTGCKTALNVLLSSRKDNVCINPIEVGLNAWKEILKLEEGYIIYKHRSILLDKDEPCDIVYKGIHYSNIGDFITGVESYDN